MSIVSVELPRVSTILGVLDDAYAGVPQSTLDTAAKRGEALHQLCLGYLGFVGGLCREPIPTPNYLNAYNAFVEWVNEREAVPVAIEQQSENVQYGYMGTPDALIEIGIDHYIIDLKFTASILRINKVQIQAYRKLDLYKTAKKAMLLHIHPITGELKQHTIPNNPHDWAAFVNALSIWKWRQL